MNNISSLIKAFIDIGPDSEEFEESSHNGHMSYRGRISELLRRISNVKYLSLTGGTLDVSFFFFLHYYHSLFKWIFVIV